MLTDKHISYLESLNGWCVAHKMKRLYDLVVDADKKLLTGDELVVVECGVFAGRSLFPMALACKDLDKGTVWGIEAWDNKTAIEGEEISKENTEWWSNLDMNYIFECFVKTIDFLGLQKFVQYSRSKSYESAHLFEDNSISVLHLDSQHNTHTIVRELNAFVPKIKLGGYLVTDDENWESVREGYEKIPSYGFEKLEHHRELVPNSQPEDFTEYAIYRRVR